MTSTRTDLLLAAAGGAIPTQGQTVLLTVTTSADTTTALTPGQVYDMVSDVNVAVCSTTSGSADDAVYAEDYLIPTGTIVTFSVSSAAPYISAVGDATGTLRISPRHAVGEVV